MRNRQSLITWGIIFLLLIGSAVLTVLLPALLGNGSSAPLPSEPSTVTITFPVPIAGQNSITVASWIVMLALALIIPALVIGAGLTFGIIYILLSRLVTKTEESPAFKEQSTALEKRQNDKIKAMRATRPTSVSPDSRWQRWAAWTTGAAILMFVGFLALLISSVIFPDGPVARNDAVVNLSRIFVLVSLVITLIVLVLTLRPGRLANVDQVDTLAIPWNFIAVLLTGLLVVGVGIGVIAILNLPQ